MHALIIDDHADISLLLKINLLAFGFTVEDVDNGAAGLDRLFNAGPYDLVTLDYRMPGLDGLDVLKCIQNMHDRPCVILCTGSTMGDDDARVRDLADAFLPKPFGPEQLNSILLDLGFEPRHMG